MKYPAILALFMLAAVTLIAPVMAQSAQSPPIPRLIHKHGRYELRVDGKPYLILGAQVNNSSNWPLMLDKVWPAIEDIHANTVFVPMAWDQIEPRKGRFNFSFLDTLLLQARQHHVHLGLLWFGTWKNNTPNYTPSWVKLNGKRYPHVVKADGTVLNTLSPIASSTLNADRGAFVALMKHLKQIDGRRHTVIVMQVENEAGVYGSDRDYSPAANKAFVKQVPAALLKAMHKQAGTWSEVFGDNASEYFEAWYTARYIGKIAAAGKAVYNLPMYANASLRSPAPFDPEPPGSGGYNSGGPTDNVLDIWKAAAPALDILTPDIYFPGYGRYMTVMDHYHRPDNPLFVSETGLGQPYAHYIFAALGHQAIGFSPFGVDYTEHVDRPLGGRRVTRKKLEPYALNYRLLRPMASRIAALSLAGKVWGVSQPEHGHIQWVNLGKWRARIAYDMAHFSHRHKPRGDKPMNGGVLIAQLGKDDYLVTGYHARVSFMPATGQQQPVESGPGLTRSFWLDRVIQGRYTHDQWTFVRELNGDQTEVGLNFTSVPRVLHVKLALH